MTVEAETAYQKKVEALEAAINQKNAAIRKFLIEGAFNRSEFIKNKTVLIPEIAHDFLNKFFRVEEINGEFKTYAVDFGGKKIFSLKSPGEYAEPEEAIEFLTNSHPQKDRILKRDASGSEVGSSANKNGFKNPFNRESLNLTEQGKLIRQNPSLAKKLAGEAGINLDLNS